MICETKKVVSGFSDILFPPQCIGCGAVLTTGDEHPFCPDCFSTLHFIRSPLCTSCGLPFTETGENHLCEECALSNPPFSMARALGSYEKTLLDVIHLFKYHGRVSIGEALGKMMATARYDSLEPSDYSTIMPVPLHPKKLREREFNQSLILAKEISKRFSVPLDFMALRRTIPTEAQVTLSQRKRAANVKGAFAVTERGRIEGRKILLVDDVYTTGSTVKECAATLMKNGAQEVAVLTLARA